MTSYTRINVSKNGLYLFATEQGELATDYEAKEVFDLLKAKFPEEEGYRVSARKYTVNSAVPKYAEEDIKGQMSIDEYIRSKEA